MWLFKGDGVITFRHEEKEGFSYKKVRANCAVHLLSERVQQRFKDFTSQNHTELLYVLAKVLLLSINAFVQF